MIRAIVREMRPWQWAKNAFVLAGVVFAGQMAVSAQLRRALLGTAAFCLLSSASYVFNDLQDIEKDRVHPRKRNRPLAAGTLKPAAGWLLVILLVGGGVAASVSLGRVFALVALGYVALNLLYSLWLKRFVLIDVMAIAIGFVLRAVAGVEALDPRPQLSPWLLVCTFFLALFIAVGKRRHERTTLATDAELHRSTLSEYPPALLDQLVPIVTSATVLAYAIYTISPATTERVPQGGMVITLPFVVYGVFRYLYLVYRRGDGGAPSELLFRDGPLLANVALWGLSILGLLYLR